MRHSHRIKVCLSHSAIQQSPNPTLFFSSPTECHFREASQYTSMLCVHVASMWCAHVASMLCVHVASMLCVHVASMLCVHVASMLCVHVASMLCVHVASMLCVHVASMLCTYILQYESGKGFPSTPQPTKTSSKLWKVHAL